MVAAVASLRVAERSLPVWLWRSALAVAWRSWRQMIAAPPAFPAVCLARSWSAIVSTASLSDSASRLVTSAARPLTSRARRRAPSAILRSRDGRVELFGGLQFGVGTTVTRRSNDPEVPDAYLPDPDARNFQLSYQVGPGLRWWARSQFALSLSAGFSGDHIFEAVNSPSGRRSEQYDFVGMYGTIGALGVF